VRTADQPISVAPDGTGGFVVLGNLIVAPVDLLSRLKAPNGMDAQTRARLRMQVFLLWLGADVPRGDCTRAVPAQSTLQSIEEQAIELPATDLPANVVVPVPRVRFGVNSLH
jgi:hypothetical protein